MNKTKSLTVAGIIAALYVVTTAMLGSLSFMALQFRLSILLTPFPFYFCRSKRDKRNAILAIMLGTAISNFMSPLGLIDVLIGLSIDFFLYVAFYEVAKNDRLGHTLLYTVITALLVAGELKAVYNVPFVLSVFTVGFPSFCLYFAGTYVMENITKTIYKTCK